MKRVMSGFWGTGFGAMLLGSFLFILFPQVSFPEEPLEGAINSSEEKLED